MRILQMAMLLLLSSSIFAQTLTAEVDSIYNFKPGKLSRKEQEPKMQILDGFWNKVKSDTVTYLPLLRMELQRDDHNPFFYYDASGLLLSLTKRKEDKMLAVNAMAKCDIDDIDEKIYVQTLNRLANEGIEVTKAAIRILSEDKYGFLIPQHALTFSQDYCLMYMLLPQTNMSYVDTLISLFKKQTETGQKSIIATLWFAYSCKGDAFLKSLANDQKVGKGVKKYAMEMLAGAKLNKEAAEFMKAAGDGDLVSIKRDALKRFSDEALEELLVATILLRKEGNCK